MKKGFWELIWSSFLRVQGVLIGVIGIALAILLWLFSPSTSISLGLVLTVGTFCLVLIVTFANAVYEASKIISEQVIPKIISVRESKGTQLLFFLEPSSLFSHDTLASFYYINDDGYERLIGIGTVTNVQDDGRIHVEILHKFSEHEEIFERLSRNDAGILKKIRVKPVIPKRYLDER